MLKIRYADKWTEKWKDRERRDKAESKTLRIESRWLGMWVLTAQYFQVCSIPDVFHKKRGREGTASREHKGKKRWLGGHGRRAGRRRGTVPANTEASQGQNCVRPGGPGDSSVSQDAAHVRLVLRPLLSQFLLPWEQLHHYPTLCLEQVSVPLWPWYLPLDTEGTSLEGR